LGVERIALALASAGAEPEPLLDVFVASVGDRGRRQAFKVASMLRDAGMSADLDFAGRVLGGQFKAANRAGAEWVIVIGDKELDAGRYTVRRMSSGEESSVPQDELVGFLEKS
jgi:histidyl-tRNA synthetase